jgi:hypothetical protein
LFIRAIKAKFDFKRPADTHEETNRQVGFGEESSE